MRDRDAEPSRALENFSSFQEIWAGQARYLRCRGPSSNGLEPHETSIGVPASPSSDYITRFLSAAHRGGRGGEGRSSEASSK